MLFRSDGPITRGSNTSRVDSVVQGLSVVRRLTQREPCASLLVSSPDAGVMTRRGGRNAPRISRRVIGETS